jgi:hypothetical protein
VSQIEENKSIVRVLTPYRGGCKDGLAEGQGSYTIAGEGGQLIVGFNGNFRNGKLNGHATVTKSFLNQQPFEIHKGEFRQDNLWKGITWVAEASLHGGSGVAEFRGAERVAFCRTDGKDELNCTDRLRKLLKN